jgi:hypothetical protein
VDVGAKRDGLVHVKDISKNYFIDNHQSVGFYAYSMCTPDRKDRL